MTNNLNQADAIAVFLQLIPELCTMKSKQEMLDKIINAILNISGAQRACLFIKSGNLDQPIYIAASGGKPVDIVSENAIQKIINLALENMKIIYSDNAALQENNNDNINTFQKVSMLCIPLCFRKQITAVLYLDNVESIIPAPDGILTIINALIIQAVTVIILDTEIPEDVESEHLNNLCNSLRVTSKEKQVLILLLKGNTKRQIAEEQSISINTVKHHISNIYEKTHARSREELADTFIHPRHPEH
jgi:DNA-binding CsgD family transcriptional regulator